MEKRESEIFFVVVSDVRVDADKKIFSHFQIQSDSDRQRIENLKAYDEIKFQKRRSEILKKVKIL